MKFFKKYDTFYIDIDVDEIQCDFFPYIKWNEVRIRTNINDENDDNDNKRRIMAYQYFKNYIRYILPENFISSVIDEFDHIYYYEYNHFINYGYVF